MTQEFRRGDQVIVTGGIVQRTELDVLRGRGVLVQLNGATWYHPTQLVIVKKAPIRKLQPGDRLIHKDSGREYVYIGEKWMLTFNHRGDRADDATHSVRHELAERPESFEYYPRSEVAENV